MSLRKLALVSIMVFAPLTEAFAEFEDTFVCGHTTAGGFKAVTVRGALRDLAHPVLLTIQQQSYEQVSPIEGAYAIYVQKFNQPLDDSNSTELPLKQSPFQKYRDARIQFVDLPKASSDIDLSKTTQVDFHVKTQATRISDGMVISNLLSCLFTQADWLRGGSQLLGSGGLLKQGLSSIDVVKDKDASPGAKLLISYGGFYGTSGKRFKDVSYGADDGSQLRFMIDSWSKSHYTGEIYGRVYMVLRNLPSIEQIKFEPGTINPLSYETTVSDPQTVSQIRELFRFVGNGTYRFTSWSDQKVNYLNPLPIGKLECTMDQCKASFSRVVP